MNSNFNLFAAAGAGTAALYGALWMNAEDNQTLAIGALLTFIAIVLFLSFGASFLCEKMGAMIDDKLAPEDDGDDK